MASGSASKPDGRPIFFYKENEDFGFMSNFYYESFTAPNPALWIAQQPKATNASDTSMVIGEPQQATIEFCHSEQYYMYCKALYFSDKDTAWMILKTRSPTECKSLGRAVNPFSQEKWEENAVNLRAMEEALWWKFGGGQLSNLLQGQEQDKLRAVKEERLKKVGDLGKRLLATGERHLIEASSSDRYWGIGYSVKQRPHFYEKNWGRNQLGECLMAVRKKLSSLVDEPIAKA